MYQDTIRNNVVSIILELKRIGVMPTHFILEGYTFEALFSFLIGLQQEFVVIIDEYCYLKDKVLANQ